MEVGKNPDYQKKKLKQVRLFKATLGFHALRWVKLQLQLINQLGTETYMTWVYSLSPIWFLYILELDFKFCTV